MLFEVGIFTSAIWLSGLLGEVTQSANQIVLNVSSYTFMVASGLGLSASIEELMKRLQYPSRELLNQQ